MLHHPNCRLLLIEDPVLSNNLVISENMLHAKRQLVCIEACCCLKAAMDLRTVLLATLHLLVNFVPL